MDKIKLVLKRIFAWSILLCTLSVAVIVWWNVHESAVAAEREVIYLKAKQLAAQQQRERLQAYQKRMQEQRLRRQYQQGKVVGRMSPR